MFRDDFSPIHVKQADSHYTRQHSIGGFGGWLRSVLQFHSISIVPTNLIFCPHRNPPLISMYKKSSRAKSLHFNLKELFEPQRNLVWTLLEPQ